jgi:hypothetical protein
LKTNSLETTDIFRGAFFLCKGAELSEVRFRNNHAERDRRSKRIASFLFAGGGLDQLDKDYMNGTALVNPVQFRESLNRLRDILFENLRKDNPASSHLRRDYAAANGGTRYDRKREDRIHQTKR